MKTNEKLYRASRLVVISLLLALAKTGRCINALQITPMVEQNYLHNISRWSSSDLPPCFTRVHLSALGKNKEFYFWWYWPGVSCDIVTYLRYRRGFFPSQTIYCWLLSGSVPCRGPCLVNCLQWFPTCPAFVAFPKTDIPATKASFRSCGNGVQSYQDRRFCVTLGRMGSGFGIRNTIVVTLPNDASCIALRHFDDVYQWLIWQMICYRYGACTAEKWL